MSRQDACILIYHKAAFYPRKLDKSKVLQTTDSEIIRIPCTRRGMRNPVSMQGRRCYTLVMCRMGCTAKFLLEINEQQLFRPDLKGFGQLDQR